MRRSNVFDACTLPTAFRAFNAARVSLIKINAAIHGSLITFVRNANVNDVNEHRACVGTRGGTIGLYV
jgi:hypothetical protein